MVTNIFRKSIKYESINSAAKGSPITFYLYIDFIQCVKKGILIKSIKRNKK